jgi:hypothetical protein
MRARYIPKMPPLGDRDIVGQVEVPHL